MGVRVRASWGPIGGLLGASWGLLAILSRPQEAVKALQATPQKTPAVATRKRTSAIEGRPSVRASTHSSRGVGGVRRGGKRR